MTPSASVVITPIAFDLAARPQGVGQREIFTLLQQTAPWVTSQAVSTHLSRLTRDYGRLVARYVACRESHGDRLRYFTSEALADACPDVVKTKAEAKVVAYSNVKTCGIKALPDLKDRCWIDPESGCWVWRGAFSSHKGERGRAQCSVATPQGRRTMGAANLAWQLACKPIPTGQVVYRAICSNKACINPEHGGTRTQAAHAKAMAKAGLFKQTIGRKRAVHQRVEQMATPVEKVRRVEELLAQGLTKVDIAAEVGLNTCTVLKIARKRHVHSANALRLLPGSSVFNLKAAA